jgi:hypothetical protein
VGMSNIDKDHCMAYSYYTILYNLQAFERKPNIGSFAR